MEIKKIKKQTKFDIRKSLARLYRIGFLQKTEQAIVLNPDFQPHCESDK